MLRRSQPCRGAQGRSLGAGVAGRVGCRDPWARVEVCGGQGLNGKWQLVEGCSQLRPKDTDEQRKADDFRCILEVTWLGLAGYLDVEGEGEGTPAILTVFLAVGERTGCVVK